MDLGTVYRKLLRDEYATVADLRRDVALIFSNCISYNAQGSRIATQVREGGGLACVGARAPQAVCSCTQCDGTTLHRRLRCGGASTSGWRTQTCGRS